MLTDTPETLLLVAGILGFTTWLAVAVNFRLSLLVLMGMLFVSGLGAPWDHTGYFRLETWLLPLQSRRAELYLGGGIILLIAALIHHHRCSVRWVGGQAWMLLAISFYSALLWFVHEPFLDAIQTLIFYAATVVPLAIVVPALLQQRKDWDSIIGIFVVLNVLSIAAVSIQFMINPQQLVVGIGRRFTGLLGNPQHAAAYYAILGVIVLSVLLNTKRVRTWWTLAAILGVDLVLLGWTGSRTGALMFLLGVTAVMYRRIGRSILLVPLGALVALITYRIIGQMGIEMGLDRLISTQDTRTREWLALWQQGMDNFVLGVGISERLESENSYLTAFATFGFGMFILVCTLIPVAMVQCWRLFQIGRRLPQWGRYTDLLIAFNMMFFVGAVFEGYIIARISFPFATMLVMSGLGGRLVHLYQTGELHEMEMIDHPRYAESYPLHLEGVLDPMSG